VGGGESKAHCKLHAKREKRGWSTASGSKVGKSGQRRVYADCLPLQAPGQGKKGLVYAALGRGRLQPDVREQHARCPPTGSACYKFLLLP